MIDDTIGKIRARIEGSTTIREERRRELLELVGRLEKEIEGLEKTHGDQARSIAGFADISAYEATRETQNPQLLDLSLKGLGTSVSEFEQSHPSLVHVVNAISRTLSNLGI